MIYCVSYDLHTPGRDYSSLIEQIKTYGTWWHHLESTWFIESNNRNEVDIRNHLGQYIDQNDELIVFPVGHSWASAGLSERATQWLRNNWNYYL